MRRFFVILAITILILPMTAAFGANISKGDTANVIDRENVSVKNLGIVRNGNSGFMYGDMCRITGLGEMTVVGIDRERVLVRYSTKNVQYDSRCPSGIIFFVTKEQFSRRMEEDRAAAANKEVEDAAEKARVVAEKNLIKRLLSQ